MASKLFLRLGCRLQLHGDQKTFQEAVLTHGGNRPLLSACNHTSVLDDPLLFGLLPWRVLLSGDQMRWALGAKEICFSNEMTSWFFGKGQVMPIVRGAGIHQPEMNAALEKLKRNAWIHMFPEGRVYQTESSEMLRFKWGIGRLVLESPIPPLFLPLWHCGLHNVMPEPSWGRLPRIGQSFHVAFGTPVDTAPWVEKASQMNPEAARVFVTAQIQRILEELRVKTLAEMGH